MNVKVEVKEDSREESNNKFIKIEIIYTSMLRYDLIKHKYYILHEGEIIRVVRYDHDIREDDYKKLIKERRKDVVFVEYYSDKIRLMS